MDQKRVLGRLLLVGAGGGCLTLAIFVGLPKLTTLMAPTQPVEPIESEGIIAEALNAPAAFGDDATESEQIPASSLHMAPLDEEALSEPGPLVARRHDGEEVPVLFPAAGEAETGEEDVAAGGLPPVLTPEEVAAAMSDSESGDYPQNEALPTPVKAEEEEPQSVGTHGVVAESGGFLPPMPAAEEVPWPPVESPESAWPPQAVIEEPVDSHVIEMTLPPPSATREVQAFLRDLGYAPGPLDGIWGKRTEAAWQRFARDAARAEAGSGMSRSRPADRDAAAMVPSPGDPVSIPIENCTVVPIENCTPEGIVNRDEGRDGSTQADLPPEPAALEVEPVRVPGTLRGVMGYRLPLVSRQEVPDQVVSGVLIPAHTTFVVLRGGEWELVDLKPEELERLRAEPPATRPERQPARRGWNPLRLFRRTAPAAATE